MKNKMKWNIGIVADDQPGLIQALEDISEGLRRGIAYHNVFTANYDCSSGPADSESEKAFRERYKLAHPKSAAPWRS